MRLRSALLALTLVLPAAAMSVAAAVPEDCATLADGGTVDDTTDDFVACTEVHYLSCEDTLDPAGKVHDFYGSPSIPLTTEAPDTSFTEGAGCGYPEDPLFLGTRQDTPFSMDFGGFVTTNIDTLTVELHDLGPHENLFYAAAGSEVPLAVRLSVGNENPLGAEINESVDGTPSASPKTLQIPIVAELSETGLSSKYVFTVTNLAEDLSELLAPYGEDGSNVFQSVAVTVEFPRPHCQDVPSTPAPVGERQCVPSDNVVPVWGATEVPASITVNGPEVGTIVDATEHNENQ